MHVTALVMYLILEQLCSFNSPTDYELSMISSAFDRIKQLTGKMTISDGNSTQKPLRNIGGDGEDIPLDTSAGYVRFCEACRSGDLKTCHELIADGVNINAKDMFDYTPLILVGGNQVNSRCNH